MVPDTAIAGCFNAAFGVSHACVMLGGAEEPMYLPAAAPHRSILRYRQNYARSALHEAAHWCIAGAERRRRLDFGYWYTAPPRQPACQRRFQAVEARVQALERLFSQAAGVPFQPSLDDVTSVTSTVLAGFAAEIDQAAARLRRAGLSPRAQRFAEALEQLDWIA